MPALEPIDLTSARHALLAEPRRPKLDAVAETNSTFKGASLNRLNMDWAIRVLSVDQELRSSLTALRSRSRELSHNNDYVARFLNKAKQNVIGPNGIAMEIDLEDLAPGAQKYNDVIEAAWERYCESPSVDGQMTMVDHLQLWVTGTLCDGESFVRKVDGYPYNDFKFALQFIDPDMVDTQFQSVIQSSESGAPQKNEIRMGVEVDEWRRKIAYYVFEGHPSEFASRKRLRIPAEQIEHSFVFKRINQTRGLPWMVSAMSRLNMLRGYEEAELVAARIAACKMGIITSETGDDYAGDAAKSGQAGSKKRGAVEITASPGSFEQLPTNMDITPLDWQHPNSGFGDFVKAMLRGAAMGLDLSYSTLTGDLREVNFSSLRQGLLDEREGWRVLQTFAIAHACKPIFRAWLRMAVTTGQLDIPAKLPLDVVARAARWIPRGWDWVDPKKDVDADTSSIRSGQNTLQDSAAKRGKDWRKIIDQRAKEIAYAKKAGVPLDMTTSGAGGVEGATQDEETGGDAGGGNPNAAKLTCHECGEKSDGSSLTKCWNCGEGYQA
jgi:lambda family phage portal protein